MEKWEQALDRFLADWRSRHDVVGVLVCGSYVTGGPSKRSDVDVCIILSEGVEWRERGDRVVDGYLIEYFANPANQIRSYFRSDHRRGRTNNATQYATGRILLDRGGEAARLKEEAREWLKTPLSKMDPGGVSYAKYGLWDSLDNLQDACEAGSLSFYAAYYDCVIATAQEYSRFLGYPAPPAHRIHELLTNPRVQWKYLQEAFPDQRFLELLTPSLEVADADVMLRRVEALVKYVLEAMGGFSVDGWVHRSSLDLNA